MLEDIYDATVMHLPEEGDVRIDGETPCPACEERLFPDLVDGVFDEALESRIVAPVDCPQCRASLEFVIEPTPTTRLGLGIWLVRA